MNRIVFRAVVFILLMLVFFPACSKKPKIDPILVGSWISKTENIQSVQVFKDKGVWTLQTSIKAAAGNPAKKKAKVEGKWETCYDKKAKKLYIVFTPSEVDGETAWVKDQKTELEVVGISKDSLSLKDKDGTMADWKRLSDKQEIEAGDTATSEVDIGLEPIVVGLRKANPSEIQRFFCINIGFTLEDPNGLESVSVRTEKKGEASVTSYQLHPIIRDVAITFFSSKSYRDTMTLMKLKDVITEFRKIMNPYFDNRIKDIKIYKIVVTSNPDSANAFDALCREETTGKSEGGKGEGGHGEGAEGKAGAGEGAGHGEGAEGKTGAPEGGGHGAADAGHSAEGAKPAEAGHGAEGGEHH
jgi:hypothetical protein